MTIGLGPLGPKAPWARALGPKGPKVCVHVFSQEARMCWTCLTCQEHRKCKVLGMSKVAVARHGPILKDSEAMRARKVFKYLRDLYDTIKKSKNVPKVQQS